MLSPNIHNRVAQFKCPREVMGSLADGVSKDMGSQPIEPLLIAASFQVSSGSVHLALTIQTPELAPYNMIKIVGEIGVAGNSSDLRYSRSMEHIIRFPSGSFGGISLGSRESAMKNSHPDGNVYFDLAISDAILLPDNPATGPMPLYRALHHPDFILRRLKSVNDSLQRQVRELEASYEKVLEVASANAVAASAAAAAVATAAMTPTPAPAAMAAAMVSYDILASPRKPVASPRFMMGVSPPRAVGAGVTSPRSKASVGLARSVPASTSSFKKTLTDKLGEIETEMKAVILRDDPVELRAVQHSLGGLLSETCTRLEEAEQCIICCVHIANMMFHPCGHVVCCVGCAAPIKQCPMCRKPVASIKKISPNEAGHRQALCRRAGAATGTGSR